MIVQVVGLIAIVLLAVILHEIAHGWVAYLRGDPTAKFAGRLTLNPLSHIDPIGTVVLPGVLLFLSMQGIPTVIFGWAKPVPVNFQRLKQPKTDIMWVGLAGPVVNVLLAVLFSLLIHHVPLSLAQFKLAIYGMFINLTLAVFNMMPIPPLDGSKIVMGLLPNAWAASYARLERFGILIVFIFLYLGLFDRIVYPLVQMAGNVLGVQMP